MENQSITPDTISSALKQAAVNLDRVYEELGRYRQKEAASFPLSSRLTHFFFMKKALDDLKEVISRFSGAIENMSKQELPNLIRDSGLDKVSVPAVSHSFYILDKASASLVDKTQGYEWLRQNGGGDLITETVNASSLAAFVRDMIESQNIEPPPEIVKYTPYSLIGFSKYTPKN